jgi:hypothetical protein
VLRSPPSPSPPSAASRACSSASRDSSPRASLAFVIPRRGFAPRRAICAPIRTSPPPRLLRFAPN